MKRKALIENGAKIVFFICATMAIVAVMIMTIFLILKGFPALKEVGVVELLLKTEWAPTSDKPSFGILYIILTSLVATSLAVLIGVPMGLLTAVFLSEVAGKRSGALCKSAIELLASIPSVIYGLIGMMVLNPWLFELEKKVFANNPTHVYTGGSNLLAAIIVLIIMIIPTVVSVSQTALQAVSSQLRYASLALGASKQQTIFKVVIPAAKSGIATAAVLGVGRALGEAMAINMVAGGTVNFPLPFHSVRTLTTQLVSEMSYAEGAHRQVLFTVGLILYLFIMLVNILLTKIRKKNGHE